ncbi:hypothetical protein RI054_18g82520 [Pseudoscourfieldia marina]
MAFALHVLARHGSCAEVVTDNGSEFKGAFDELLEKALIDHRHTSREHPQADGLAERAVQTVKEALRRCLQHRNDIEWDEFVPWVVMGYMASEQSSSGYKPYELLHGHPITVPPAVKERMTEAIDVEVDAEADYARLSHQLLRRAELMQRHMAIAGKHALLLEESVHPKVRLRTHGCDTSRVADIDQMVHFFQTIHSASVIYASVDCACSNHMKHALVDSGKFRAQLVYRACFDRPVYRHHAALDDDEQALRTTRKFLIETVFTVKSRLESIVMCHCDGDGDDRHYFQLEVFVAVTGLPLPPPPGAVAPCPAPGCKAFINMESVIACYEAVHIDDDEDDDDESEYDDDDDDDDKEPKNKKMKTV